MSIYTGIVKNNQVVLPEDLHLPDGVEVTIYVPEGNARERIRQDLRARGLLERSPQPSTFTQQVERRPLDIPGKPVSATLIEERR